MNILTIGASPFLLTRSGRIHADILQQLHADGHAVTSLVWHHDEGYFMPETDGSHWYEVAGKRVCQLHPFIQQDPQAVVTVYEYMKKYQPNLVLTLGDYDEVAMVHAVKAMYPSFFRWLAVMTIDTPVVNENFREQLQYIDHAVCLSDFGGHALREVYDGPIDVVRYGPSDEFFPYADRDISRPRPPFTALLSAKNAQSSNIPAFLRAIGKAGGEVKGRLHTNYYDPGEYDLSVLMNRYKVTEHVQMTEEFVSIKDGPDDRWMRHMYNKSHVVVDSSVKSATALGMLEAMACKVVPVGPAYGRWVRS
jgi:glycosyltransferase involved in cell wall biosynthesis